MSCIPMLDKYLHYFHVRSHLLGEPSWFPLAHFVCDQSSSSNQQQQQQPRGTSTSRGSSSNQQQQQQQPSIAGRGNQHEQQQQPSSSISSSTSSMAFLPQAVINQRRNELTQEIVTLYHELPDNLQNLPWYGLMCPCGIDCRHMPLDEVPRLRVKACYFAGEFDYYFVEQPFVDLFGFKVRWHCDECHEEIACGCPTEIIFPYEDAYDQ